MGVMKFIILSILSLLALFFTSCQAFRDPGIQARAFDIGLGAAALAIDLQNLQVEADALEAEADALEAEAALLDE